MWREPACVGSETECREGPPRERSNLPSWQPELGLRPVHHARPVATCSRTICFRIPRTSMRLCVLLRISTSSFLQAHWETATHLTAGNAIATQPIRLVPFQTYGILPVAEQQSLTRGSQSGGVTDQPQYPRLYHSSSLSARSLNFALAHLRGDAWRPVSKLVYCS